MKNTSSAKVRKSIIASLSAFIAAGALITGLTVFSASAVPEKDVKGTQQQTVTAASQEHSESKAEETGFEDVTEPRMFGFNFEGVKAQAEKYEQEEKAAAQEKSGQEQVNEYGKHPGECGYGYVG